jgi:hypothetical protein
MGESPAKVVCNDMTQNQQRALSEDQAQQISERVGQYALQWDTEIQASDTLPKEDDVAVIGIGADAACMFMTRAAPPPQASPDTSPQVIDGRKGRTTEWRQATVGTIAFYDKQGERLKTIYVGQAPPENTSDGKAGFWASFETEVSRMKLRYPNAKTIGITDGAVDLMNWAEGNTDYQVLDFFHAAEYLTEASAAYFTDPVEAEIWASLKRHELLEVPGAVQHVLKDMKAQLVSPHLISSGQKGLKTAIGYFEARIDKMNYADFKAKNWPIGSGVTEAACKLIVKNRFCGPGMKWAFRPAAGLMKIRCLLKSDGRWDALWSKICPNKIF